MSTQAGEEQNAKALQNYGVSQFSNNLILRTYTQPERSLDNGTDESAILSRGSSTSSNSPRPDHNSPAIARVVPPVAYAMFLELKEFVLARLALPFMTCDIEADVANSRSGRRLAA